MNLTLYHLRKKSLGARSEMPPATSWAQFGDDVLLYADGAGSERLSTVGVRGARRLRQQSLSLKAEHLHVVVQNGRMFQQEHPSVPVLLDKGRYLLVKLDPRRARRLKGASPTCYGVFPLRKNQVVFDVRDRARVEKVAWIQKLVDKIDRTMLESNLTRLASFQTRHSTSSHFKAAAIWAHDQLKSMGYITRFQNVSVSGRSSRSIIADKKGGNADPRKVILVTAHLDSINLAGGATAPAPGADDNGSGSAGLLEIARAMSKHPGRHDVRFILFGGEEQGLFGSQRYVSTLSAKERGRILSVINMDMIGTLNTATQSVMLEGAPLSQRIIDSLSQAAAAYTSLTVETSLNPFASDHVPFINAGIPAVLTIEGADNTNSNIHSSKDVIDHINFDFALEILRMNVAFVAGEIGQKV
jgi:Peptidase family M28